MTTSAYYIADVAEVGVRVVITGMSPTIISSPADVGTSSMTMSAY
jgi:hypothetical protein